jgi:CheY-like chemotaxis protein
MDMMKHINITTSLAATSGRTDIILPPSSAAAAAAVVAPSVYDLILMDYQMPRMDGPTAITRIRRLGYTGKIVGLTGNVLDSDKEFMRTAGANHVLSKPVQHTDFETIISEL